MAGGAELDRRPACLKSRRCTAGWSLACLREARSPSYFVATCGRVSSMKAEQRKVVRLNRSGGSRSVTVPKTWLRRIGLSDDTKQAELVLTETGIPIEPIVHEPQS